MTEPSFSAFRQAFYDPGSRIRLNGEVSQSTHSCIYWIKWEGAGFFEKKELAFSKHLNSLIGGRGTGKSALIESIAFVLEHDLVRGRENQVAQERLREHILKNAKVTVKIGSRAQHGLCYIISRRFGEQATVKNENGEISHLRPNDLLPKIEILRQNEILEIEKDEEAKIGLLNSFLPDSSKFDEDLASLRKKLADNRSSLLQHQEEFDSLEATLVQEEKYKEQLKQFKKLGIADKLKNFEFIEKEESLQGEIGEQFEKLEEWVDSYQEIFDLSFLDTDSIKKLPNKEIIQNIASIFRELKKQMDGLYKQAKEAFQEAKKEEKKERRKWQAKIEKMRDAFDQAIAKIPGKAGKTGKQIGREYQEISTRLSVIESKKKAYSHEKKAIERLTKERNKLLEDYKDTAFQRFDAMNDAVKELNKSLTDKLQISISRAKNREQLKEFLLSIRGIGDLKIKWLGKLESIDLVEWSQWIERKEPEKFLEKYKETGLSRSVAESIANMDMEQRLRLEEIELKDTLEIELNTAHDGSAPHYVKLEYLSTGQKCTAILNLLLLNRADPLIIDQPEDNLDNAFIAERIVSDIRKSKLERQFLFATHNANIPVFGDAELIAVLSSAKDKGSISEQGSIDKTNIQKQAAEILEGGRAAFDIRKEKYGF